MYTKRLPRWAALASACLFAAGLATAQAPQANEGAAKPAADAPDLTSKLDAYLQAAVRNEQFSGSVLVAREGKPLFDRSYGMASIEFDVPNTSATIFRIASLTKQFTAMAILQLQERGKLKVGDPVCRYLADCPASWQPITLRHLLTHTSGIRNVSSLPDWDENLGLKRYRHADFVDLFRGLPLEFTPGEKYTYSNSGYYLLGLVIERASGKPYAQYLQEAIFTPLQMRHTAYTENREIVAGRASGYYSRGAQIVAAPYIDPTTTYAAGGITSTTGDLLRWDQALYTDKLASRRSRDEMFTPFKEGYAYGWRVGEKFGRHTAEHSGSLNGFSSYILRFPDQWATVIVLGNGDRMSAGKTGKNLAAILFGEPCAMPKPALRDVLWNTVVGKGAMAAIGQYRELRRTQADEYDFGADTLVDLGYDLFSDLRLEEAAAIFEFSLETFPKSAYSYDGLADIALERGDRSKAIAWFEKSLALDLANEYASLGLERAKRGR